jgi:glucans biosynthesis protein
MSVWNCPSSAWRKWPLALAATTLSASVACGSASRSTVRQRTSVAPLSLNAAAGGASKDGPSPQAEAFESVPASFERVLERARTLAEQPPRAARRAVLPQELRDIHYDAYRRIRFRPERALWRGEPGQFEAQFFHPGFYFQDLVDISTIERDQVRPLAFSNELFSYDGMTPPRDSGLGFTGFRLHTALNTPSHRDELIVFQGASYFRALGQGNVYGLSARGLAIDMGEPGPEEFPRFSEFYLLRPEPTAASAWVFGLLESRRATGAYAFRILPGKVTRIEVTARLFLRENVAALGLAPLTSMYAFGEEGPNRFGDFRPEVHDSDGLALHGTDGEWLFRPLRNPQRTTVSSFRLDSPRGFGLVQRDRSFASFQDLEARYQDRPSVWVEPLSGFERGSLRLLEIATELETDDNIAIAWIPRETPERRLDIRYRLHVGRDVPETGPAARTIATRLATTKQGTRFLVDFAGGALEARKDIKAIVSVRGGRVLEQHTEQNPFTAGSRASFEIAAEPNVKDVELRAFLRAGDDVLSETWSYLWQPNR